MAEVRAAVERFLSADLGSLTAQEKLALVRDLEVARRILDAGTERLVDAVETSGAHSVDGHRTTKAALKHLGRLPGAEAFARVQMTRALRLLPAVRTAYGAGAIPTASVRAIAAVVANPRIAPLLDDVIDTVIAEQASTETHDDFVTWLQEWARLADTDGTDPDRAHRDRDARLRQDPTELGWELRAHNGALHGACMAEVFAAYEAAEWATDRDAAIAEHGPDATVAQFPRTPAQRRADALLAIFRRAAATPADATPPDPLVNIIIDQETLETEIARAAGDPHARHDPTRAGTLVCRTTTGHPLHPSDALAALVVGTIRRVVLDTAGTVIELGRRRRLFTGSARDAATLQAAIRDRGGTHCFWRPCDNPRHQIDHHQSWRTHGTTDPANSGLACGHHNRLKEAGFRPVRRPDGRYDLLRPDGTTITPAA